MNAVEFVNVTKEFPGVIANENVSFAVKKGTIHALIGENGAGKSTLMSVLFGLYEPTRGQILVNENKVFFKGPNDANLLGIGMVHQHFKLVDVYSNLDNIILGEEWETRGFINRDIAIKKIKALQNTYNLQFDLYQKSGEASVSTQQKVEIMKMLYRDNEILVFDEPTAVLTDEEIQGLLKSFEIFKQAGKTIIFISHKLKEIEQVADYATVLRKGKVVGNFDIKKTDMNDIVVAMVGSDVVTVANTTESKKEKVVFKLEGITTTKTTKKLNNISLEVHAGEILAVAGVEGNGQRELEEICSGMTKPDFGKIFLNIKDKDNNESLVDITKYNVAARSKNKISFIPADRHHHGLILDYSITDNSIIRRLWDKEFQTGGFIKNKNKKAFTDEIIEKYDVRGSRQGKSLARSLSGGNQQKFIVGREMETEHDFIIIVQPTRGLDVGAINNIHQKILKEKEDGKAILLISYELDEIIALADTIAVINSGSILKVADAKKISREEIGSYMASEGKKIIIKWWETPDKKVMKIQYQNLLKEFFTTRINKLKFEIKSMKNEIKILEKLNKNGNDKNKEKLDNIEKSKNELSRLKHLYLANKRKIKREFNVEVEKQNYLNNWGVEGGEK